MGASASTVAFLFPSSCVFRLQKLSLIRSRPCVTSTVAHIKRCHQFRPGGTGVCRGGAPGICPGSFTIHTLMAEMELGIGNQLLTFSASQLQTDMLLFLCDHSTSSGRFCHLFAPERSTQIQIELRSSASGIINKLGLSTNLSSEQRSSLFSPRLLIYLLLSGVWTLTS